MENSQANNHFLAQAPVSKLLVKFAVPCVLSMLVSAMYNIVDQIFIGQSVGYLGNAATNVVYPFTVIALALALLLGDGCAALFSLSLGSGERETSHRCIGNAIVLTLVFSVVLAGAGWLNLDWFLHLFGVTEASYAYARDYMQIILLGIPFYMFTSSMNSAIRADGAPGYAMVATVLGAVLNIILDPIAIFALHMGVRGAAIATIVGQAASCLMTVLYFRKPRQFRFCKDSFRPCGGISRRLCQMGVSSFITQFSIVIITCVANNLCVRFGAQSVYGPDIPLSALGIVFKVFGIVIAFSIGIAVGGQPIIGFNYGAGRHDRVLATYRMILLANIVVGAAAMLLFELCPQAIVRLFGNESALYNDYANLCFRIYLGGILLCCVQKASSIFLQSIGKPVKAMLLSLSRDVVFLVPAVILMAGSSGITGMLWAGPLSDILAFTFTMLLIVFEIQSLRKSSAAAVNPVQPAEVLAE